MMPWPRPAKRSARTQPQPQTTEESPDSAKALARRGGQCDRLPTATSRARSGHLAENTQPPVPPLCEPGHDAFKRSDDLWTAAPFAGIQPVGRALWECRHCPACGSTVIRPVSVGRALALLIDALLACPPADSTLRSAMLLSRWAEEHLPLTLRSIPQSAERQAHHGDAAQHPL